LRPPLDFWYLYDDFENLCKIFIIFIRVFRFVLLFLVI